MSDGTIHAFRWTPEAPALQDLGTYPSGALVTVILCCNNINDRGQIAGASVDPSGNMRALLWENNVPVDLNSLVPADSPWYLLAPGGINNAGEIAVTALNLETFDVHAVVLSPASGIGRRARAARPSHQHSRERHSNSSNGSTGFESERIAATRAGLTSPSSFHRGFSGAQKRRLLDRNLEEQFAEGLWHSAWAS
jgi:probable HAF family extracellular repeat protein